jgi:tyrosinase
LRYTTLLHNMTDIYNITGIQAGIGPHGEIPVRKDVETWFNSQEQQDRDQVWLFAHALQDFQAIDYTQKVSYYQIAG